jgi:hypothetical protein
MRRYVFNYVEVFQLLQNRKTFFLKSFSLVESIRWEFSFFIRIMNSTVAEKQAFDIIQFALSKSRHLTHANMKKQLYEDVDVSKEFEINVMIYHLKDETSFTTYSFKSNILFILFLNRQLKSAEKNYWSTELEIADIVFIIRKIRHMIESFKKSIIIFTDHEFALNIVKQTSLVITSIDRLNVTDSSLRIYSTLQRHHQA